MQKTFPPIFKGWKQTKPKLDIIFSIICGECALHVFVSITVAMSQDEKACKTVKPDSQLS